MTWHIKVHTQKINVPSTKNLEARFSPPNSTFDFLFSHTFFQFRGYPDLRNSVLNEASLRLIGNVLIQNTEKIERIDHYFFNTPQGAEWESVSALPGEVWAI